MAFSGFQSNAFQNNAFQIISGMQMGQDTILGGGLVDWHHHNPLLEIKNREYREAKAREEEKKQNVIDLRLEAQALRLREKELANEEDKQSQRQLRALRREQQLMQHEILRQMELLSLLQASTLVHRNNMALLVLIMSDPFLAIGGLITMQ